MGRCKGICQRFAAKRPWHGYRYAAGQRPCTVCNIFVEVSGTETIRCPCCNNKLRISSRNKDSRKLKQLYNVYAINEMPPDELAELIMNARKR
jgi:DNA-directed RNA polymerase subunit RPC12/RpoP